MNSIKEEKETLNNLNIINESKINIMNNNINSNNIDDLQLKSSPIPNLIFQENITIHCDCTFGLSDSIDVFKSIKDNNYYIILSNNQNNNIEIIDIISKNLLKSLEGNTSRFILLKYYLNTINKIEYLITADIKGIIKVISISDNYNIISKIIFPKELKNSWKFINCSVLFNIQINSNKMDIIIVSSRARYSEEYPTKIYDLKNGLLLKDVSNTKNNKTRFIIPWYNETNDQYYLIEFCEDLLIIVSLFHNEIYAKLDEEKFKTYSSGFIYKKNKIDYLYTATSSSEINIWDLYNKELVKKIRISNKLNNMRLYGLLLWRENYLIVNNDTNKSIIVIELTQNNVVTCFWNKHNESVRCLKRIKHKIYGECLLTAGDDHTIKLWKNIPIIYKDIFE